MNKIAVVYKSKYGSTKQYAMLLKDALSCDVIENKNVHLDTLTQYDTLVFAGSLMGPVGMQGLSTLKKNYEQLKHKNLFILTVGASRNCPEVYEHVKESTVKDELSQIPFYYARGQWNFNEMKFMDKKMCSMLRKMLKKKDVSELTYLEKEMLDSFDTLENWVSIQQIQNLVEDIKKANS